MSNDMCPKRSPRNRFVSLELCKRRLAGQWRSEVLSMCDKCVELDGKIEHYRKLASAISDRLTIEGIADRIKEMEAQKVQFHPEQKR
jgi:hypothetical protein